MSKRLEEIKTVYFDWSYSSNPNEPGNDFIVQWAHKHGEWLIEQADLYEILERKWKAFSDQNEKLEARIKELEQENNEFETVLNDLGYKPVVTN